MKKILLSTICILAIILSAYNSLAADYHFVKRVVDGDTIVLDNNERVRLIGIDTPETVHPRKPVEYFGKEASAFTKRMCEGKRVRLEYDQTLRDKYGRLLAYVYLENGTHLNAEIIKQGYGFAYTQFPFKYMQEFREYEQNAREQGLGLWGQRSPPSSSYDEVSKPLVSDTETVYITDTGKKYHRAGCRFLKKSKHAISRVKAQALGYTPCKVCKP